MFLKNARIDPGQLQAKTTWHLDRALESERANGIRVIIVRNYCTNSRGSRKRKREEERKEKGT